MRVEGEHHGRAADAAGHGEQIGDDPGVTPMDAVEIPDRDGAAAESLGQRFQGAE